jgi:WhiB family redox-sensing transcriptional regulator
MTADLRPGCEAPVHDTYFAYKRRGCRCPEARAANTKRKRLQNRDRGMRAERLASRTISGLPPFRSHPARACATADADVFFTGTSVDNATAKKICGRCPLTRACAGWAIRTRQVYGIWGGLTYQERKPHMPATARREVTA